MQAVCSKDLGSCGKAILSAGSQTTTCESSTGRDYTTEREIPTELGDGNCEESFLHVWPIICSCSFLKAVSQASYMLLYCLQGILSSLKQSSDEDLSLPLAFKILAELLFLDNAKQLHKQLIGGIHQLDEAKQLIFLGACEQKASHIPLLPIS